MDDTVLHAPTEKNLDAPVKVTEEGDVNDDRGDDAPDEEGVERHALPIDPLTAADLTDVTPKLLELAAMALPDLLDGPFGLASPGRGVAIVLLESVQDFLNLVPAHHGILVGLWIDDDRLVVAVTAVATGTITGRRGGHQEHLRLPTTY